MNKEDTILKDDKAKNPQSEAHQSPQTPISSRNGFYDLRGRAQSAYDWAMEKLVGTLSAAECSRLTGEIFYEANLPGDQRRLGSMLVMTILGLDEHLKRMEIFDGPALHQDTRRLLVSDVIASAHLQSQDLGQLHKLVEKWYPKDPFAQKIAECTVKLEGGKWKPAANPTFLGDAPTKPKKFAIEDILGNFTGEEFRHAYGTLEAVIHGTAFMVDADQGEEGKEIANALRNAFYAFNIHMKPILKGEVAMKGEG